MKLRLHQRSTLLGRNLHKREAAAEVAEESAEEIAEEPMEEEKED